jgi:hypothetical protein
MSIIDKRFNYQFNKQRCNIDLKNYFNINIKNCILKLDCIDNNFYITFKYKTQKEYEISLIELPIEINNYINEFLKPVQLEIIFLVKYSENAFLPSKWFIHHFYTNAPYLQNLDIYYKYIIDVRNEYYSNIFNWYVFLSIDRDILDFLVRLNLENIEKLFFSLQ